MNVYNDETDRRIRAAVRMSETSAAARAWIRRSTSLEMSADALQKFCKRRNIVPPWLESPTSPGEDSPKMTGADVSGLDFEDDLLTMPGRQRAVADTDPAPGGVEFDEPDALPRSPAKQSKQDDLRKRLFDLTKRGPVAFEELCDKLDLSPGKTRELVDDALSHGMAVHVEHNHVGIKRDLGDERIQPVGVAPTIGERQIVGVISDTHLGSKYCLREQLSDFVHYAYERGAREILHPGDVVDGMYKHGLWEVSHSGLAAQAQDLFEVLPRLPGLSYRAITGNHCETFEDSGGFGVGPYLENYFRQRGRDDLHFYGRRSAFLRVGGAVFHLWHPRGSASYAKSYKLQKIIEKYSSGEKPHVLLVGHYHQFCHVYERGVHGFLCPTFQGGGSAFGNSLGGAPTMGGMLLSWDLTEHATMRNLAHEYRAYFEVERPHNLDDDTAMRAEFKAA
jgi:hypothetical protein